MVCYIFTVKAVCTIPYKYYESPERRVLNLEPDGILCVPALEFNHFTKAQPCVAEHQHPGCIEIIYCLRGSLTFACSGRPVPLFPGHVFVIQPEERHHLVTNQRGLVTYGMFFRLDTQRPLLHLPKKESEVLRKALAHLPDHPFTGGDRIRTAFKRLFFYFDTIPKGVERTLKLRGAVLDLLLTLLDTSQRTDTPQPSRFRLEKIIQLMRDQPERDYPSGWIAREAALSDSLINMQFKKLTGLPPHAYLISCRLNKARELLTTTTLSVTELAIRFKFSSSQHFAAHFRRFYGITPSEARQGKKPYRGL